MTQFFDKKITDIDKELLINSAKALLALDASNSLVPHGIGGLAKSIIQSFIDLHEKQAVNFDIDKEREAFEKVFKLPIYLAWDNKFEGYIPKNKNDESSKLAAYAYDNRFQGWLARAQSQNEQQPKTIKTNEPE